MSAELRLAFTLLVAAGGSVGGALLAAVAAWRELGVGWDLSIRR